MVKARESLGRIQDKRGRKLMSLVIDRPIDGTTAYEAARLLRQMGDIDDLDIMLDSAGGDLDAAYKILKIVRAYANNVAVIVPFYAKSAATLIALGGDSLILCKGGELGPMDPQVPDINTGVYVPANSIKETMDFLESLNDQFIKVSLTEKIPTLMMGAYRASAKVSKQYLEEVLAARNAADRKALIHMFTEKFFSHGYPMDATFLKENGIAASALDGDVESMIYELFDHYREAVRLEDQDGANGGIAIIHSEAGHTVIRDNNRVVQTIYDRDDSGAVTSN